MGGKGGAHLTSAIRCGLKPRIDMATATTIRQLTAGGQRWPRPKIKHGFRATPCFLKGWTPSPPHLTLYRSEGPVLSSRS